MLGRDSAGCPAATITVLPIAWKSRGLAPEIHGSSDDDGSFDIEVGALFASETVPTELEVVAEHPDFLPGRSRVRVEAVAAGGSAQWRVDVQLVAAAIAEGRVLGDRDEPLADARVTAWILSGVEPTLHSDERAETRADGTFRLLVAAEGRTAIVAQARGWRPASETVALVRGQTVPVPVLRLGRGLTVSGRVRWPSGAPAEGVEVAAQVAKGTSEEDERVRDYGEIVFSQGRVVRSSATGETDTDGRFEIGGLEPGHYMVWLERVADAHLELARKAGMREVDTPAGAVDFVLPSALLTFLVRASGEPVAGASMTLMSERAGHNLKTGDDGRLSMPVAALAQYHVWARHDGYEVAFFSLEAPDIGEERTEVIDLEPLRPRPALLVHLDGPDAKSIGRVGVVLYSLDEEEHDRWGDSRDAIGENGVFRVDDLHAGRFRVVVRPGGDQVGGGYFLYAESEVELPPEGEVPITVALRPAGRMRVAARDGGGQMLPARCTVRDSVGAEMEVRFLHRDRGHASWSSALMADVPCEVEPSLPPGRFSVECSLEGYVTRSVEVDLAAGKSTQVDVVLQADN